MDLRLALACLAVSAAFGLAGCNAAPSAVREIEVHIGYSDFDAKPPEQYLEPKEIRVKQGERIRLVVTNDDRGKGAFHDLALELPGYSERIEHEVPMGRTTRTCIPQSDPDTKCTEDKSYFVANEKGSFKIWCEVGPMGTNPDGTPKTAHEQQGMWGTLIVE